MAMPCALSSKPKSSLQVICAPRVLYIEFKSPGVYNHGVSPKPMEEFFYLLVLRCKTRMPFMKLWAWWRSRIPRM